MTGGAHLATAAPGAAAVASSASPESERLVLDAPVPTARRRAERSPWNYLLGITLIGAGAVPIGVGVHHYRRDGECVRPGPGGCFYEPGTTTYLRYDFGTRSWVILDVGIVVAGTGLYVIAGGPIRRRATVPSITPVAGGVVLSATGTF